MKKFIATLALGLAVLGFSSASFAEDVAASAPAVAAALVEPAIEAIENAARTGKIGDGKIFVSSLEQVVRIRTGETGTEAI